MGGVRRFMLPAGEDFLSQYSYDEFCIAYDIATPHAAWVGAQAVQPFKAILLHDKRCPLAGACKKVENGADSTYMAVYLQFIPVCPHPLFLLGAVIPMKSRSGLASLTAATMAALSSAENSSLNGGL